MFKVSIFTLCVIYACLSVGRGKIDEQTETRTDQGSSAVNEHNKTDALGHQKTHIPLPVNKTAHAEDSAEEKAVSNSDQCDRPKTAAGEMAHGMTRLTDVEKEFYDHFKGGSAGHWLALRSFEQIHLVNICKGIFRKEKGFDVVANYLAEPKTQFFKVQLKADEVENLTTDVIQCIAETIPAQGDDYERNTFYVAEGKSPKIVFKLNTFFDAPEDTLRVYETVEIADN